ncbi:MAG: hypothetical protein ACTSWL_06085 [Promethearchaeota archaeon]
MKKLPAIHSENKPIIEVNFELYLPNSYQIDRYFDLLDDFDIFDEDLSDEKISEGLQEEEIELSEEELKEFYKLLGVPKPQLDSIYI